MRRSLLLAVCLATQPSTAWADGIAPSASPPSTPDAQSVAYAVLIVSRERLDTGTACDIDLYV